MKYRHDRTCTPAHAGVRRPIRYRATGNAPALTHRVAQVIAA
ncbi:hypothetical protein OCAE111667_10040 [Occultella aeris]|uniref:Uncharacterized protein n=1 Tax=Occultella aeris TaxID=2761496 RepID=A0A7M4DIH4_9MICO|nr:hypothetical protein [Occultella aeris]VZO36747.1 hypothetical protein HALOF300_01927 [Occultella aeris]